MSAPLEPVPPEVRLALREAIGGSGPYVIGQIRDQFELEGFYPDAAHVPQVSGDRRGLVEQYHAAIDFRSREQCERYLRVIERVLDDLAEEQWRSRRERVIRALSRAGIHPDEQGRLHLPAAPLASSRLVGMPTTSGIRLQARRLDRLDQEPEELVGAAKELVEATAKHVLTELGEPVGDTEDVASVSKRALARLKLHPTAIAPTTKGAEAMLRLLGGLAQIPGALAELLNMGYGTGHGREGRVKDLQHRHAEFVARAAVAYSTFLLDTLEDERAPWRSQAGDGTT